MLASGRLTNEWTDTLEEAFGANGSKGRDGELFVIDAVCSWGWLVKDNETDYQEQVAGQDIWIKKPTWSNYYSVDVKANLDKYGNFYVVPKEWLNPKKRNHRFWHVNVDTGWMAWYDRIDMQEYIKSNNITNTFKIGLKDKLPFEITRRRHAK